MEQAKNEPENNLSTARGRRSDAETALNYAASEAVKDAQALCERLEEERELVRQKMAEAEKARADAEAYHQLASAEINEQAQEILDYKNLCARLEEERDFARQSTAGPESAGDADQERVCAEAHQLAQEIIAGAEIIKAEADAYYARLTAEADQNLLDAAMVQITDPKTALNNSASEASEETKQLSADLAKERAQAQQLLADAERTRAEADTVYERISSAARQQAQEILADAEVIKAEADAYSARLTAEADQNLLDAASGQFTDTNTVLNYSASQALQSIADAEMAMADAGAKASAYCAQINADAIRQAQKIITDAENARSDADAYSARLAAEADHNTLAAEKARTEADTYAARVRSEADADHKRVSAESQKQAREVIAEAENARVEADALCERLASEADQKTLSAEKVKSYANTYAERTRAEADAYHERVSAEIHQQAQEIITDAEKVKAKANTYAERARAEADTYNERVSADAQQQAREIITDAENVRSEASTYRDELVASTRQRCKDLMREFVLAAEIEIKERNFLDPSIPPSLERELIGGSSKSYGKGAKPVRPMADGPALSVRDGSRKEMARETTKETTRETSLRPEFGGSGDQDEGQLILGLDLSGSSKAFPVRTIIAKRVINDSITGHDVVITFEPTLEAGLAFNRRVDGRELTFSFSAVNEKGMTLMGDAETGTTWEALTGRAIQGPLKGQNLVSVSSEHAGLFDWREQHPNTTIYQQVA